MAWKFTQIEPQPARGKLVESMWDDPNWIAEEKYDGDRRIAQFCGKVVRFTGRRQSVKDGLFVEKTENVPHLSMCHAKLGAMAGGVSVPVALDGTVLDGEMIIYDKTTCYRLDGERMPKFDIAKLSEGKSKYVTSIMGSLPEEAVRKQIERGWLRYVVFDCLFYKGKDIRGLPLVQRRQMALTTIEDWKNPFASFAESSGYGRASGAENKRKIYDTIVARGGEGVILKHVDHTYGDKNGWVKVKKQATADVVIMGFIPAKEMSVKKGEDKATITKYAKAGLIGAVQCGQYRHHGDFRPKLEEVATISGIDDLLREEMTKNPKRFIGKVVEIEHNGCEPTGRFRHPRFNRFRPDKRASDCEYREDES